MHPVLSHFIALEIGVLIGVAIMAFLTAARDE